MTALGIDRTFARLGGEATAMPQPRAALRRRVDRGRRQGEGMAETPRRFRPRLAAGFGDGPPSDGLQDFDRSVPSLLAEIPVGAIAAVIAALASLILVFSLA